MDVVLSSVGEEINTSLELFKELRVSPRCDGFDSGIKSNSTHLESDLIIAFAGSTVRYVLGTLSLGDSDLGFGDKRTGDRGA